jgi:predicted secreted protein
MSRITYETPIKVTQFDEFSISLETDVPTGYDWIVSEYDDVSLSLESSIIEDGYRVFIFRGRSKGTSQLILDNISPDTEIIEQREYTIIVPAQRTEYRYGPNLLGNAQMET